jgi:hypothetical protein
MLTAGSSSSTNYWNNAQVPDLGGVFDPNMDLDLGLFGDWDTHHVDDESLL